MLKAIIFCSLFSAALAEVKTAAEICTNANRNIQFCNGSPEDMCDATGIVQCTGPKTGIEIICPKSRPYCRKGYNGGFCSEIFDDSCTPPPSPFECTAEGIFPDPLNCKLYHRCTYNEKTDELEDKMSACGSIQSFNPSLRNYCIVDPLARLCVKPKCGGVREATNMELTYTGNVKYVVTCMPDSDEHYVYRCAPPLQADLTSIPVKCNFPCLRRIAKFAYPGNSNMYYECETRDQVFGTPKKCLDNWYFLINRCVKSSTTTRRTTTTTELPTTATEVITEVPTTTTEAITEVPTTATEVVTELPTTATEENTEIPTTTTEAITEVPTTTTEVITEVPTTATEVITELPTTATEVITEVPTTATEVVTELPTTATEVITELPTTATEAITELPTTVTGAITEVPTTATEVVTELPTTITEAITEVPTTATEVVTELPTTATEVITEVPTTATEVVTELPTTVTEVVTELPTTATEVITELPTTATEVVT